MIMRRRESGIAQEGLSARYIWLRAIITSIALIFAASILIGIIIYLTVH